MTQDYDALATTPAASAALKRLRAAAGAGGPTERHCLRCRHIAGEIARRRGWTIDDELLTIAATLHDIGLYPSASRGGVYTADGAALAREILAAHGWTPARTERCAQAIDLHHDLRSQLSRGSRRKHSDSPTASNSAEGCSLPESAGRGSRTSGRPSRDMASPENWRARSSARCGSAR